MKVLFLAIFGPKFMKFWKSGGSFEVSNAVFSMSISHFATKIFASRTRRKNDLSIQLWARFLVGGNDLKTYGSL